MIRLVLFRLSIVILCSLLMIGHDAYAAKANTQSLDRVVVIINDTVITQTELDEAISSIKKQLQTQSPPENVLRKQVLEQLINRKLQMQLAEQAGVNVSDADLDKAINQIASSNKISTSELYSKLAEQGLSKPQYRKEIREQLILQQVQQQEVGTHITITPQEVDDFLRSKDWKIYHTKEYHLEDILIALPDAPSSQEIMEAKTRAENLVNKIRHGMSFKQAALTESNGSQALEGGDLGWRKLPNIPSEFASQLVNMKPNDLMGPLLTSNGFHIVLLAGIRNAKMEGDAKSLRKQVEQLIYQRKFEEGLQKWISKLRSAAFINMHPES